VFVCSTSERVHAGAQKKKAMEAVGYDGCTVETTRTHRMTTTPFISVGHRGHRGGRHRHNRRNGERRRTEERCRFAAVRRALRAALLKRSAAMELAVDVQEEEHQRYRYWLITDHVMPGELAFEARRAQASKFCAAHTYPERRCETEHSASFTCTLAAPHRT
jgi:hypothetical protein